MSSEILSDLLFRPRFFFGSGDDPLSMPDEYSGRHLLTREPRDSDAPEVIVFRSTPGTSASESKNIAPMKTKTFI